MSDKPPPRKEPPVMQGVAWPLGKPRTDDPIMQIRIAAGAIAEIITPEDQLARVRQI